MINEVWSRRLTSILLKHDDYISSSAMPDWQKLTDYWKTEKFWSLTWSSTWEGLWLFSDPLYLDCVSPGALFSGIVLWRGGLTQINEAEAGRGRLACHPHNETMRRNDSAQAELYPESYYNHWRREIKERKQEKTQTNTWRKQCGLSESSAGICTPPQRRRRWQYEIWREENSASLTAILINGGKAMKQGYLRPALNESAISM